VILAAAWIACLLVILGCQRVRGKEDKIGEKLLYIYIYIYFKFNQNAITCNGAHMITISIHLTNVNVTI